MKNIYKILSVVLFVAVLVCSVSASAYISAKKDGNGVIMATSSGVSGSNPVNSKDETVYVIANSDGTVKKVIVSDWIQNNNKSDTLSDVSNLTGIENLKGDETFESGNNNSIIWNAQGNDIYYQGQTDKKLPVNITVSYTLDGKKVTPDELKGKSGKLTIRFDYENNCKQEVSINGQNTELCVPYAMLTGMILDNSVFSNVTLVNAKAVNDGDRQFVVGVAFPGMNGNLGLTGENAKIPDYIEVTADVTGFTMTSTVSVATNEIFNEIDLSDVTSDSDLSDKFNQLTELFTDEEMTEQLNKLYTSSGDLTSNSQLIKETIDKLSQGADKVVGEEGANNEQLTQASEQLYNTILGIANNELHNAGIASVTLTKDKYADQIAQIVNYINENVEDNPSDRNTALLGEISDLGNQMYSVITAEVRKEVAKQVTFSYVLQKNGYSEETYKQGIENGTVTEEKQQEINNAVNEALNDADVQSALAPTVDSQMQTEAVQQRITAIMQAQVASVLEKINGLKNQLDSYNDFYKGLNEYTAGVDKIKEGLNALNGKYPQFDEGIKQYTDGTKLLIETINELKEEIKPVIETINGEYKVIFERAQATLELSKNYKSFTGITDDMDGKVKFIYRTDSIN